MPSRASCMATRAQPLSITVVTPSIVSDVSAMFVARISLRPWEGRRAASCAAGGTLLCRICSSSPTRAKSVRKTDSVRLISPNPGRKNEDVPDRIFSRHHLFDRCRRLFRDRPRVMPRRKFNFNRKHPPRAIKDRCATQILCNWRGVERCRHHDKAQFGPHCFLNLPQQRQREIGVQAAFVEFIQNHAPYPPPDTGSPASWRVRIPSVITRSRVCADVRFSNRI